MEKKYIVEVFVPTQGNKGKKGMIGTAYPVGDGLLLTARHVLFPSNRDKRYPVQVRFSALGLESSQWQEIVGIKWEGDEELDVSLIEVRFPPQLTAWGQLMATEPSDQYRWTSEGYATAGGKKHGRRLSTSMGGRVFAKQETESYFELGADNVPQSGEDWRGASGSPVFVGGWIIGVITQCPKSFGSERLIATKMKSLLAHEDLARHLLPDQRQQRFDVMCKKITELLARSKTLMRELATQTDIPDQTWKLVEDAKQSATGLAGVLLGMDLPPVLEACDNLHWQFVDEGKREEARLISQLTLLLLPALYDFAVVETVRGDRFNIARAIIQVPAALRTVAEIIMAGVDRRAMQVHYDPHEYFQRGTQCLPKRPEAGADESGDQSRRDFLEQITQLLTPEFDPEFMDNFRAHIVQHFAHKEPGREYSPALKTEIKSAAIILRRLAERYHQTYYYVFDMPPDPAGRQTAERVIAQLKADFPAIVFLTLTSDEGLELQEQELFAPLPDMFSRLKAT